MSRLVIVEGPDDERVLRILWEKAIQEPRVRARKIDFEQVRQGDMLVRSRMAAQLGALIRRYRQTQRIVVCRDCECTEPAQIADRCQEVADLLTHDLGLSVRYTLVVHSVESWLLGDPDAVGQVLRRGGDWPGEPEQECRPKKWLQDHCRKPVKYAHTLHNPLIAKRADVERIRKTCPSFGSFCELLR